jgi:hypothetical protein
MITFDPMSDKYPSLSPYNYCANNPVKLVDPNGEEFTKFEDINGVVIKEVNDGSNAVFRQTGNGTSLHYSFQGYDESQGGSNEVNMETAMQEQQQLNMNNSSLQQNGGTTHCNQATQNVMRTVESACNNEVLVTGRANDMINTLNSGTNPNYVSVTQDQAQSWANQGGLSIVGYQNLEGSGHVATYSVGDNARQGQIANIGPTAYTGFVPLNMAIAKNKAKTYYMFSPGYVASPITITP